MFQNFISIIYRFFQIAVSFESPVSNKIFSEKYLMVESEVFFEPYHRVLKVLQNSRTDDLPMKKYIIDVQVNIIISFLNNSYFAAFLKQFNL